MAGEIIIEKPVVETPKVATIKHENILSPEKKLESTPVAFEKSKEALKVSEKKGDKKIVTVSQVQDWQRQRAVAIDNILAEGLNEVFIKMNPAQQAVFKKTGEETVTKISKLLMETKVRVNKIVDLIRKWLKLIPGVNKFFLEQEVKIKADKIMKLKNKY